MRHEFGARVRANARTEFVQVWGAAWRFAYSASASRSAAANSSAVAT